MEAQFCPRCETQLEGERPVCPACAFDPHEPPPPPDPFAGVPYLMRYPSLAYIGPLEGQRASTAHHGRTRLLVMAAFLAVVAFYGAMMSVSDMDARPDGLVDARGQVGSRR